MDLMGYNTTVVDLEVLHSPDDLSTGWTDKRALGLSLAGAYSYRTGRILWFDRITLASTVQCFVDEQPLMVSFNGFEFDFPLMRALLREEAEQLGVQELSTLCDQFKALCAHGYDILQAVWEAAGTTYERGLNSLDALCQANGLGQKTGPGAEVPQLWAQGRIAEVTNSLQNDILLTAALFELVLRQQGTLQRRTDQLMVRVPDLAGFMPRDDRHA